MGSLYGSGRVFQIKQARLQFKAVHQIHSSSKGSGPIWFFIQILKDVRHVFAQKHTYGPRSQESNDIRQAMQFRWGQPAPTCRCDIVEQYSAQCHQPKQYQSPNPDAHRLKNGLPDLKRPVFVLLRKVERFLLRLSSRAFDSLALSRSGNQLFLLAAELQVIGCLHQAQLFSAFNWSA